MKEVPSYLSQSNVSKNEEFVTSAKKSGKKKSRRRVFKMVFMALIVGAISYGGYVIASGFLGISKSFQPNLDGGSVLLQGGSSKKNTRLIGEDNGRINFLLLGYGGAGYDGEYLTDTVMVASFDPINKVVATINIPRDLAIELPEETCYEGMYDKINSVYTYALHCSARDSSNSDIQAEAEANSVIKNTVGDILGIKIHYLAKVNFDGFRDFVDEIGGVTVDVERSFNGFYGKSSLKSNTCPDDSIQVRLSDGVYCEVPFEEGVQKMDGETALMYSRIRKVPNYYPHLYEDGDFARSARQQKVLVAMKEKILSTDTLLNPLTIRNLMVEFGENIKVDLTPEEALRLIDYGKDIDAKSIEQIVLSDANYLYQSSMNGLGSVVLPTDPTYKELQSFISEVLKRPLLSKENGTVTILNGTYQPGMAGRLQAKLEEVGFNVINIGNYETKFDDTVIYQNLSTGKNVTKELLRSNMSKYVRGLTVENPDLSFVMPEGLEMSDFTVIIGADMIDEI
jgi:LCP family protein required for cell wall assembly